MSRRATLIELQALVRFQFFCLLAEVRGRRASADAVAPGPTEKWAKGVYNIIIDHHLKALKRVERLEAIISRFRPMLDLEVFNQDEKAAELRAEIHKLGLAKREQSLD